jgi:hypothetical protein
MLRPIIAEIIISKLLNIVDSSCFDGVYKSLPLCTNKENDEICVYSLCVRGKRDENTPFYCASTTTHIVKEYYLDNEIVWAEIIIS